MAHTHRPYCSRLGRVVTLTCVLMSAFAATSSAQTAKAQVKPTPPPPPPPAVSKGRLLAINDFHGAVEPPTGSSGRISDGTTFVVAGGAEYLATHLQQLRAQAQANGEQVLVLGAGDMVGSSPFLSAALHDEPTIEVLSALGLEFSSVGDDEFADGVSELKRLQYGGCHPVDGCSDADGFAGARFRYLAANVVDKRTKLPVLLPADVRIIQGVPVGFVGVVSRSTPSLVNPTGIQNVEFLDEAQTANLYAVLARLVGIRSLVLLIHEGGRQDQSLGLQNPNTCQGFSGPIAGIVSRLRPEFGIVISGHTHAAYVCSLPNSSGQSSLVTSASNNGLAVTSIGFTIDKRSKQFTSVSARNVVVTRDVTPDAAMTQRVTGYRNLVAPLGNRVIGTVTADLNRIASPTGETVLGSVVADSQLAATAAAGAQIAFVNPGSIRTDLLFAPAGSEGVGEVTYAEAFTVQPFDSLLVTLSLTGAQLKNVLEQQFPGFDGQIARRILQVSASFSYTVDPTRALGDRVSNLSVSGVAVDPTATYRVTVNSVLADGIDGFSTFVNGTNRINSGGDLDALVDYFGANSPVAPPALDRIRQQ